MPQHEETISLPALSAAKILTLAYGTFQQLGWHSEYASEIRLVGYTKKTWNSYHDHIIVDAENGNLTVTSKLPESASFDLMRKNKRNVAKFLAAFETVKANATPTNTEEWNSQIEILQQNTSTAIVQEEKDSEEADAVMNLSSGSKTVTYAIMGINVLVFIIMAVSGVHIFEPTVADLAKWGANYGPYTTGGEWWRLITSTFIHIGIIHIALNMYALYMAGVYLEPMLGKGRYIVAYLCTGVLASVASIWWHGSSTVSAGASGAIFGLYGVFLALLSTKLIPQKMRKGLLQSIGIFVVYNLIYGASSGTTDNAAHIGGLVSGLIVGYIYFLSFKKEEFRPAVAAILIVAATIVITAFYLNDSTNDALAYQKKVDEILVIQDKAMAPFTERDSTGAEKINDISAVSSIQWAEAKKVMDETEGYKLSTELSLHRKLLKEYIDLRIKHTDLLIQSFEGKQNLDAELGELVKQINEKVAEMSKK